MTTDAGGFYVGDYSSPAKYRLAKQVGRGGEATLWLGYVNILGAEEAVAIKVLHPSHSEGIDYLKGQWEQQAEILRFVSDPSVVRVRDYFVGPRMHRVQDVVEPDSPSHLYLVMNWVEGRSFRDWVALHPGNQGVIDSLSMLVQVARALDELHSGRSIPSKRPVIHGDLSPGNVMITSEGQAILVDFGLVHLSSRYTSRRAGTPGFAAPEVWRDGLYSSASDRYSFAALAYFALIGDAPPSDLGTIYSSLFAHPMLRNATRQRTEQIMSGYDPDRSKRPAASEWLEMLRAGTTTSSRQSGISTFVPPQNHSGMRPVSVPPRPSESNGIRISRAALILALAVVFVVGGCVAIQGLGGSTALPPGSGSSGVSPTTTVSSSLPATSPSTAAPSVAPVVWKTQSLEERSASCSSSQNTYIDLRVPQTGVQSTQGQIAYNSCVTPDGHSSLELDYYVTAAILPGGVTPSVETCSDAIRRRAISEHDRITPEGGLAVCISDHDSSQTANSSNFIGALKIDSFNDESISFTAYGPY